MFEQSGIKIWMASNEVRGGEDFFSIIEPVIKECSCFILLLTKESQESSWVEDEILSARDNRKTIVPIQLTEVPLNDKFKFFFRKVQIVKLPRIDINGDKNQKLIATVKDYMKGIEPQQFFPKEGSNSKKKLAAVIGSVMVILLALIISGLVSGNKNKDSNGSSSNVSYGNSSSESSSLPTEINQIPERFKGAVTSLKYADALSKSNKTVVVKVGEMATLTPSWPDAVVYSEDSTIAIGEGALVKGVSVGETYVVISPTENMGVAYYIIVTE